MKLELHLHDKIHSVESQDHPDITEMAELFKGLLVSAGFHPQSVDSLFELDSQWFTEAEVNLCQAWKDMQIDESLASESRASESHIQQERDKLVEEYQNNLYRPEKLSDDCFEQKLIHETQNKFDLNKLEQNKIDFNEAE